MMNFMPELSFEGNATWNGETECTLSARGKQFAAVSPPPSFGGKEGYCTPEDIFAAALASCINTIYMLIAKNSQLNLKNLETKATVKMKVEGMEKLIFTNVHFVMSVSLVSDNERERKKATTVYGMAQKICPIRQSWGEGVPISFELNFL
jgi:organic hydroperoxide reductase OsmC/OhrA